MLKRNIFFYAVAIGLLLQACYYDNETILYKMGAGGTTCDTTNVTYAGTIAPIMATNCNVCHVANSGNNGGVITSDYANLKLAVTKANSVFVRDVNWASGANPMPKNNQKLSSCVLSKINTWVRNGALNN